MREIKNLARHLSDEVDGVLEYSKEALALKTAHPSLAEMYRKLAEVEMGHVKMMHDSVLTLVENAKNSGAPYPAAMEEKWDAKHKRLMAKMAKARSYMDLYR